MGRGVWSQAGFARRTLTACPPFFVSVASKRLKLSVSGLESTFVGIFVVVDSKGLAFGRFGYDFDRRWLRLRLEKVAGPKKKRQLEAGATVYPSD